MRRPIQTPAAPAAIGPYSQAIEAQGVVYLSGQIPLDPATMTLVGETAAEQTHQVMNNLSAVLKAAGCGFEHVVRCTIYLADMGDFAAVNEVYGGYMPTPPPARATIQVARLPKDALVEIDAIAVKS
ncbi:RidA family protein [Myxococcota bacterium]|nr:RidA family protein [Myxococcota bacterium]MBU1898620.1 RidA family protein [Myxococcota bacterium]